MTAQRHLFEYPDGLAATTEPVLIDLAIRDEGGCSCHTSLQAMPCRYCLLMAVQEGFPDADAVKWLERDLARSEFRVQELEERLAKLLPNRGRKVDAAALRALPRKGKPS